MTNHERARGLLQQARERHLVMARALQDGAYAFTVRLSQECVELALKAALYFLGIDIPKWHDVGQILKDNRRRFPDWFAQEIDRYAHTSQWLRNEREPSMYGDEERGIPAHALYDQAEAQQALAEAKEVFAACERLIGYSEKGRKLCPS